MAGFMGLPLRHNLLFFFSSVPPQIRAWEWNAPPIKSVNWWKARRLVSARMFATAVTLRSRSAVQMEMSILMNAICLSSLVSLFWRTNHWTCPTKANVVSHLCLETFSTCVICDTSFAWPFSCWTKTDQHVAFVTLVDLSNCHLFSCAWSWLHVWCLILNGHFIVLCVDWDSDWLCFLRVMTLISELTWFQLIKQNIELTISDSANRITGKIGKKQ